MECCHQHYHHQLIKKVGITKKSEENIIEELNDKEELSRLVEDQMVWIWMIIYDAKKTLQQAAY